MSNVSMINGHIDEPKGLTDEQIKKSLECCSNYDVDCDECPANGYCDSDAFGMASAILDLINRRDAEVERLTRERDFYKAPSSELARGVEQIKSKAIKEFWSKVRAFAVVMGCYHIVEYGDNTVKEMDGE